MPPPRYTSAGPACLGVGVGAGDRDDEGAAGGLDDDRARGPGLEAAGLVVAAREGGAPLDEGVGGRRDEVDRDRTGDGDGDAADEREAAGARQRAGGRNAEDHPGWWPGCRSPGR